MKNATAPKPIKMTLLRIVLIISIGGLNGTLVPKILLMFSRDFKASTVSSCPTIQKSLSWSFQVFELATSGLSQAIVGTLLIPRS